MTIGAGWYLVHEILVVFTRITEKALGAGWGVLKGEPNVSSLSSSWIKTLFM